MTPRIYLAGPDVFLRDAAGHAERKKRLCAAYGFAGVFPLDAELELDGLPPREQGVRIGAANEELIRSCQLLIAQITPFRGPSADAGTAYEMGYARALGLPIYAYTNVTANFLERTLAFVRNPRPRPTRGLEDADGMELESFELVDNLMLAGAIASSGGRLGAADAEPAQRFTALAAFEDCLRAARSDFAGATAAPR